MNALIIVFIAAVLLFLAYRFYARKLELLWGMDPARATPAYTKFDSVDYIPAKNWLVLFGHHFASIAGAGPIVGPVIAVMLWGWLPAFLWVIVGTIFIGGVHDFGSLITSVKEGGSSIADVTQQAVSRRAKVIFSLFVLLSLILVIAVFAYLCAETLVAKPQIVLPSFGLIFVAMLVGYLLYNLKFNIVFITIFGLLSLGGLILLGNICPVNSSRMVWLTVLFIYAYFASILPVNILLQPRDYLSAFILFFGVGLGYLGLIISSPNINMPYFHRWTTTEGYLWPALFVTVACGAVSGFHTLVAGGTTSKQLANERHAKRIGYGGMVAEALVAILVIVSVAVLFKNREDFSAILKSLTPIGVFGESYGLVTRVILGDFGTFIAITMLNAFILTTLDTATRISRYISEELFKIKNRYLSTLLVVFLSALLAFSGKWNKIWPVFGASNQLVAALALLVLTCWLLSRNKPIRYTLIPAIFMLLTTFVALVLQVVRYFKSGDHLLFSVSLSLIILALFITSEVYSLYKKARLKCQKA